MRSSRTASSSWAFCRSLRAFSRMSAASRSAARSCFCVLVGRFALFRGVLLRGLALLGRLLLGSSLLLRVLFGRPRCCSASAARPRRSRRVALGGVAFSASRCAASRPPASRSAAAGTRPPAPAPGLGARTRTRRRCWRCSRRVLLGGLALARRLLLGPFEDLVGFHARVLGALAALDPVGRAVRCACAAWRACVSSLAMRSSRPGDEVGPVRVGDRDLGGAVAQLAGVLLRDMADAFGGGERSAGSLRFAHRLAAQLFGVGPRLRDDDSASMRASSEGIAASARARSSSSSSACAAIASSVPRVPSSCSARGLGAFVRRDGGVAQPSRRRRSRDDRFQPGDLREASSRGAGVVAAAARSATAASSAITWARPRRGRRAVSCAETSARRRFEAGDLVVGVVELGERVVAILGPFEMWAATAASSRAVSDFACASWVSASSRSAVRVASTLES